MDHVTMSARTAAKQRIRQDQKGCQENDSEIRKTGWLASRAEESRSTLILRTE